MKILLTGSSGFLGNYIYEYLSSENSVDTLNRTNSACNINLAKSIPVLNNDYNLVIHCAGLAHKNNTRKSDFKLFNAVNVRGTDNLLIGLKNNKLLKNFIFISSVSVFESIHEEEIDKNCPLNAKDPYGKSKFDAENLIIDWCKINNVNFTIIRRPLIVGENAPCNFGAMINGTQNGYYFNISGGETKKSMFLAEEI